MKNRPFVTDNCKDCVSNCEHAGKDREFICIGGVSCKKTKDKFTAFIKWLELRISSYENSLNSFNQGLCQAYKNVYAEIFKIQNENEETKND